jgi:uncharacterized protein
LFEALQRVLQRREKPLPIIRSSSYRPPLFLANGHLLTIYPNLCREVEGVRYRRQRIRTPDDDFLDLDRSTVGATRVALLAHGLEGNATRPYMLGMVRALNLQGWDAVVWNFRGCSGEPNRKLRFYHSGDTQDLQTVLTRVLPDSRYGTAALIGFSLGGNVILKYLGEHALGLHPAIRAAVAFSVPCDLAASATKMARPENALYMRRFMRLLHGKILAKMQLFPGEIDDRGFSRMRTFKDFDEHYTAPLHGFKSALDYWNKASSKPLLARIAVPTLLVNAVDDPFLAPPCYPYQEAMVNPHLFLETPKAGGHVGFVSFRSGGKYWSESRAIAFLSSHE